MKNFCVCTLLALLFGCETAHFEKQVVSREIREDDILKEIDDFQNRYFEIAKKHYVLGGYGVENYEEEDYEKLNSLREEVINKINKSNTWLKKYRNNYPNSEDYKIDSDETIFSWLRYEYDVHKFMDSFFNDIYNFLKSKLSSKDFCKLRNSQRSWLKQSTNYIEEKWDGMSSSEIEGKILECKNDMYDFRILLLILYAQQRTKQISS